jgi:hypothetical protein
MKYNVPTRRYGYALTAAQASDLIEVQVEPIESSGSSSIPPGAGQARLILDPQSPGSPPNQGNNLSLTNVKVSITAPLCVLTGLDPDKPAVINAGLSGGGQTAYWILGNVTKGNPQTCCVSYALNGPGHRRFEFVLEAAELPQPVRLHVDVSPGFQC